MAELSSPRKSLKAPIHNPYDKFTQPEFDAWIGGITGTLRKALGHVDEEEISHTNGTPSYDDHSVARLAATEDDHYREADEEAEESHTRNIGKGKARDPRDGPGLGPGTIDEPIELDSDEDEVQEEKSSEEQEENDSEEDEYEDGYEGDDDVNNAGQYICDRNRETRENHANNHVQEDSDLEDEEGVDKEVEADYEWGEDNETRGNPVSGHVQDYSGPEDEEEVDKADYVWEEDDSPPRSYHPAMSHTRTPHLKNRQDDSIEEEHYEDDHDEVDYNSDYDEDYEGGEYNKQQGAEAEPIEISEDEEENDENVPPVRQFKPKRGQPSDDVALAEEEDANDDEDIQRESLFSDIKVPHHANMEEDMEDEYGYDQLDEEPLEGRKAAVSKLVYERDDSEQPFENNTSFPPLQLEKSPLDQPVSLRDPWDGPSHFAEDFYSGGEVHQSSGTMLDPNHLSELDASSDIATFLTPGIMTPNVISSDNVPIPSAALLSQTFHPTEDAVMERAEEDEHGQELPDLGLQKGILAPGSTVENERQVDSSIDNEPSATTRSSKPLTVELQDSEDLYHGLDNFIETLTNSTAHLAHTIQEQEPSVSSSADQSQEDRGVNESGGKALDEDNLTIEDFTEQKDTEVIDVDELDDTDELVEDEGHTVASQLAEEAGPATTASIRRGTDGPLDSPSITQTDEVFGNEGDEMLKSVEEARKPVTSSSKREVDASLDSPSITRTDVHEAAVHILQLSSVPVDGYLGVPRKDAAVLPNVPAEAQVEETVVSSNAEIIQVDVNAHDSHGEATPDQQAILDRDDDGLIEAASETVTLTQEEFHGEPCVDLPSGDMVFIPETVNTNIDTSGRDTFEPSALEVVPSMQTLEADSPEDRMDEVEESIGFQGQTLVESSPSSPQALPPILPGDGMMQEATVSGSGVLEVEVEVEVDAKTEAAAVEASEAGVSHDREDEVDLSVETDQIEEVSGPAVESEPQNPGMDPSVQPVSDHTTLVQGSTQEDIPEDSDIPFDPKDGEDELDELAYPEEEPTVSTITDTNPVAGVGSAEDNTDEARELVRESSQPIDVDQQASNVVEGSEQNPPDLIDVAVTEPSIYPASNTSTTSTLVGASLSTPMFLPNGPAPSDSSPMPDPTSVVQDDLSATSASPDTREQSDDEDGEDFDAEGDLDPDYVEVGGVVTPVASTRSASVPDDIEENVDREPSPVLNDSSFDDADGHSQIQEEFDQIQRDDAELESIQPTTADHFVSPNEIPNSDEKTQPLDDISEVIMDGGKGPQEVTDGDGSSGALDVSPSVDTPEVTTKSTVTGDVISDGTGDDIAITENPIASGELLSTQVAETLTKPGSPDGRGTADEEKSANDSPIPDILPSTQVAEVVQTQVPEAVTPADIVNGQRSIPEEQMENQIPVREVDPMTETDPFKLMGSQSTVAPGAVETEVQDQHDSNKELAENLVASTVPDPKPDDTTTGPTGVHPDSSAPVPPEANASSRGSKRKRKSSNPSHSAISPNKKDFTRTRKPSVAIAKGKGKRKQRQDSETPSMSSSGASAAAKLLQPSSRASSVASVATGDGSAFTHTSLATIPHIPPSQFPQLMLHSHSRPRPPPYQPIRPSLSLQTHMQMRGPPTAQSSGGSSHSPDVGPSPSRQRPVVRTMTSPSSTRSTRSTCRYHKISLPETDEDNSPDIFFLVPGCSLVDTELIKEEEIKDLGDATLEDSIRKVGDIETLDVNNYVLAVIRQLVGPDKEQDVYYLPKLGEERARKVHHKKRRSKKFSRDSGIPDGSFTANDLLSPTSSRAPMSAAGSSSTDASRRKKGNDMDHATVTSYSSGEDSDYDEETRGKRFHKKSKAAHEEISELQSGSQSKVPKRGIKRRLGTDAAEYQPGETDEETDELPDVDSPKRPRKQGKKRARTDIQDERQTKRPKVPIPVNGSADGEPFNQDRPLPDPSAGLNLTDMQWPPPQTQSQSHLP